MNRNRRRRHLARGRDITAGVVESVEPRLLLSGQAIFANIEPDQVLSPGTITFLEGSNDSHDYQFLRINGDQRELVIEANDRVGSVDATLTAGEYVVRQGDSDTDVWREMCFSIAPSTFPTIVSPTDRAEFTGAISVDWNSVSDADGNPADHYELQLERDDSSGRNTLLNITDLTETSYTIAATEFEAGGRYRVLVRGVYDQGGPTEWNAVHDLQFISDGLRDELTVSVISDEPRLPEFLWRRNFIVQSDVTRTEISVTASGNATAVYERSLNGNSFAQGNHTVEQELSPGAYQVTIQTLFEDGTRTQPATVAFTVDDASVDPPAILTLSNYSEITNTRPELTWTSSASDASYQIWISPRSNTQSPVVNVTGLQEASYTVPNDLAPDIYNVWVRADRGAAGMSEWSEVRTFPVHPYGIEPIVITGGVGQQNSATPLIEWQGVPNVHSGYELFISTRGSASTAVYNRTGLEGTSHQLETPLQEGVEYLVWVRATYEPLLFPLSTSQWGAAQSLTIGSSTGGSETTPLQFTAGAGNQSDTTPLLEWAARSNVARYELWINPVGDRSTATYYRNDLTTNSHELEVALPDDTRYEAWVRAFYNDDTKTRWGSPVALNIGTVTTGFPDTPIAFTGGTGEVTDVTPTLTWEDRDGAQSYDLYINEAGSRGTAVYRTTITGDISHTVADLLTENTEYEVWIRATYRDNTRTRWGSPVPLNVSNNVSDFDQQQPVVRVENGVIQWDAVDDATTYTLAIDSNVTTTDRGVITTRVRTEENLTGTSYNLDVQAGDYTGYLQAVRADGIKTQATRFDFVMDEGEAFGSDRPVLSIQQTTVSWTSVTGAVSYELWVNEFDEDGQLVESRVVYDADVTGTSADVPLSAGIYRAWVRAVNSSNQKAPWSQALAFFI